MLNQLHQILAVLRIPRNAAGYMDARRHAVGQVKPAVSYAVHQLLDGLLGFFPALVPAEQDGEFVARDTRAESRFRILWLKQVAASWM